jgi:hypothetical protein
MKTPRLMIAMWRGIYRSKHGIGKEQKARINPTNYRSLELLPGGS